MTGNEINIVVAAQDRSAAGVDAAIHNVDRLKMAASEAATSVNSSMAATESAGRSLGTGMTNFGATIASFIGNLASTAAMDLISSLESATRATIEFGLQSAMAMQSSQVAFTSMLGSAQKATTFLTQLQHFALVTPFQLADLRTYAARLLAVGTNAADIIPLMTRIGDATSAVGTGSYGIERAVNALNDMKLANQVNIIHLRELAYSGVPIYDALAAKLHTTTANIKAMVSASKISVDDVFAAILTGAGPAFARINGMMDKQSKTLAGTWSNLKDSAQQTLGKAFMPLLDPLSKLANWAGATLPKVIAEIKGFFGALIQPFLSMGLDGQLKKITQQIDPVRGGMANFRAEIVRLINTVKDHKQEIGNFILTMVTGFELVMKYGPKLIGVISDIVDVFSTYWGIWDTVITALVGGLKAFIQVALKAFGELVNGAAKAFGWLPGIGPLLRTAAAEFDAYAQSVNDSINGIQPGKTVQVALTFRPQGSYGTALAGLPAQQQYSDAGLLAQAAGLAVGKGATVAGRSQGSYTGHAAGGPGGGWSWVGERGAELLRLPQGSMVYPAGQSRQMAAAGAASERGLADVLHLRVAPGADGALASLIMNMVRTGQLQLARA